MAQARKDLNPSTNGSLCVMLDNPVDCSATPILHATEGKTPPKIMCSLSLFLLY